MKYKKLLEAVKKLDQLQNKVEKASERYKQANDSGASTKRKAALSDKLVAECWERDKQLDIVHCELVNANLADPKPAEEYEPREITQSAGYGHSISTLYCPPKPECLTLSSGAL